MEFDKYKLVNEFLQCIEEAIEIDSDDSDKEDILIGLTELCIKATLLPTKREWVKPFRKDRKEQGSFAFITKELSDDASYRNFLKVTKEQFKTLLNIVQPHVERKNTHLREAITAEEKLAVTLRFLGTGESFRSLDCQSRVSKCAISGLIPKVCDILWKHLKESYMKFPNNVAGWEAIAKEFAIKWQFPNCLGAVGGRHIHFRRSRVGKHMGENSIILLALVDANCRFIFVDIGCSGASNHAVFLQSKLCNILQEGKDLPPNAVVGYDRCLPYVAVADDTFPLQHNLLKPYALHTTCNDRQIYNSRLSRAQHVVEHAFDILFNRFNVFLAPMNLKVETVQQITLTCCALHNYFVRTDDTYVANISQYTTNINDNNSDNPYNPRKGIAEVTRQQFMAYFNCEGKLDWL